MRIRKKCFIMKTKKKNAILRMHVPVVVSFAYCTGLFCLLLINYTRSGARTHTKSIIIIYMLYLQAGIQRKIKNKCNNISIKRNNDRIA